MECTRWEDCIRVGHLRSLQRRITGCGWRRRPLISPCDQASLIPGYARARCRVRSEAIIWTTSSKASIIEYYSRNVLKTQHVNTLNIRCCRINIFTTEKTQLNSVNVANRCLPEASYAVARAPTVIEHW